MSRLQEIIARAQANQERAADAGNIFSQLGATIEQHQIIKDAHDSGWMSDDDFEAYMDDASRVLPPGGIGNAIKGLFGR